ncbi:hypothetical protein MYX65_06660 [Acidobacteria bacterium AH-259-L09]|nr:hypothetical protein [Acidobacteria bacterium AH-259-L09]
MGRHSRKVFGAFLLALLMSTQTLTGQFRKEELVYTLTFSGEVISTPTTAKVISKTPTTLSLDKRITLDLTAFARSHFPAGEGLNCFARGIPDVNAKEGFVEAWVEVQDLKIPGDPSQAIVVINFIGRDTDKTIDVVYRLKLRGTRTCTKFPQYSKQTCTIHLEGWRVEGFTDWQEPARVLLPGQGCVSDPKTLVSDPNDKRYDPLKKYKWKVNTSWR